MLLDHFSCQAADYSKEAAYYAALMNWKIRSDDGKQAVLDIGDWGGLVIRGGYVSAAGAAATPTAGRGAAPAAVAAAAGGGPRAPRNAAFDRFCWGIEPWDAKKVEAELRKRGLDPGRRQPRQDFQSFHVKDPDGFDLQISNGNRKNRRQGAGQRQDVGAGAVRGDQMEDGVARSHLVRGLELQGDGRVLHRRCSAGSRDGRGQPEPVRDRRRRRHHHPSRRRRQPWRGPGATPPARRATIGHISFGITPFDPDQVKAELDKRGLNAREDTGGRGDIHTAPYKSYHTTTPNGFDLQISATTKSNRSS